MAQKHTMTMIAATLVACAGLAQAQSRVEVEKVEKKEIRGSLDKPLHAAQPTLEKFKGVTFNMTQVSPAGEYSLKIDDGNISAKANGKEVPADRIRVGDGRVDLLDEQGEVMATFALGSGPVMAPRAPRAPRELRARPLQPPAPPAPPEGLVPAIPENPPPVMVGITMSTVEGEVSGILVDSVIDGLPASKAGLKAGDVIVKLDGKAVERQEQLREVLKGKKPGDTLAVVVERDGAELNMEIELAKFEGEKLMSLRETPFPGGWTMQLEREEGEWYEQAREALEKAMAQVRTEVENIDVEKMQADVEKSLAEAMKALEQAKKESGTAVQRFFSRQGNQAPDVTVWGGPEQRFVIPAPTPPSAPGESRELTKQLERLSKQLERLNERLDQMERRLNNADHHDGR